MDEKRIEEWWDNASTYYQKEIDGDDMTTVRYGPFGSTERKLKLLGNVSGKRVLELGCGGGQVSIALARSGAICTGIDISSKQLEHAEEAARKKKIKVKFIKMSISDLKKLKKGSYDIVISVFVLQYVKDLKQVLLSVKSVLKRGGIFVFSVDHPFYITIDPDTMKLSESYNKSGILTEKERWPDGSRHTFMMYKRKVSEIINDVIDSGLRLESVLEPFDPKDKVWGQGYRKKLVRMLTPVVIFKSVKK